ncbi:MAG TPA: hypothetical protein VHC69_06960 [Polyangiaceae bacterium]|nr:hypothetical protein [Polyangiaceae bacterium]
MEEQITIVEEGKSHEKTGEAGASLGSGRERRATFEACRIDPEVEKSARSAENRRFSARENRETRA